MCRASLSVRLIAPVNANRFPPVQDGHTLAVDNQKKTVIKGGLWPMTLESRIHKSMGSSFGSSCLSFGFQFI